jgi:hypothetical protein
MPVARPLDGAVAALLGRLPGPAAKAGKKEALMGRGIAEAAGTIGVCRAPGSWDLWLAGPAKTLQGRVARVAGAADLGLCTARLARRRNTSADQVRAARIVRTADLVFGATLRDAEAALAIQTRVAVIVRAADLSGCATRRLARPANTLEAALARWLIGTAGLTSGAAVGINRDTRVVLACQTFLALVTRLAARLGVRATLWVVHAAPRVARPGYQARVQWERAALLTALARMPRLATRTVCRDR